MNKQIVIEIDKITELLYQQKNAEAYEMLGEFISLMLNELKKGNLVLEKVEEFNKVLLKIMDAMISKDEVLVADILNYELKEYFE